MNQSSQSLPSKAVAEESLHLCPRNADTQNAHTYLHTHTCIHVPICICTHPHSLSSQLVDVTGPTWLTGVEVGRLSQQMLRNQRGLPGDWQRRLPSWSGGSMSSLRPLRRPWRASLRYIHVHYTGRHNSQTSACVWVEIGGGVWVVTEACAYYEK